MEKCRSLQHNFIPMKRYLLTVFAIFLISAPLYAQRQNTEEVTNAQRGKNFSEWIAKKIEMTKGQKDSLATIFTQFMDDMEKYRAGNNPQITAYLTKIRDDTVKSLFRNDASFDQYLLVMADIQKQRPMQPNQSGQGQGKGMGQGKGQGGGGGQGGGQFR